MVGSRSIGRQTKQAFSTTEIERVGWRYIESRIVKGMETGRRNQPRGAASFVLFPICFNSFEHDFQIPGI